MNSYVFCWFCYFPYEFICYSGHRALGATSQGWGTGHWAPPGFTYRGQLTGSGFGQPWREPHQLALFRVKRQLPCDRKLYEFLGCSIIMFKNQKKTYGFWTRWSKALGIHMVSTCDNKATHSIKKHVNSYGFVMFKNHRNSYGFLIMIKKHINS